MAGCPKCAVDLIHANPHKRSRMMPNGFLTFESLVPGERLNLPSKWFDGSLDDRPKAYFAALAHHDGVTHPMLGDGYGGVLGDYATLDAANAKVAALSGMGDQQFIVAVSDTAATVDASVREITSGVALQQAESVRNNTLRARARNADLNEAFVAGSTDTTLIRNDILNDFSAAMVAARSALKSFYEPSGGTSTSVFSGELAAAARAAASAIAADENYCVSIAHSGTPVNTAVHAFKTAWNSSQSQKIPINTGNYEQATAEAIANVLGGAPLPCEAHSPSPPPVAATPTTVVLPQRTGMSTGAIISIGLLGAGAVGGAAYLVTQQPPRGRRRTSRRKRR